MPESAQPICIATRNAGKVAEMRRLLSPLAIQVVVVDTLSSVTEDGETFHANAFKKATVYAQHTHMPCLADDSGLQIDALDGQPGVRSARYAGDRASADDNNVKLLRALEGVAYSERRARFRCVLVLVDPARSLCASPLVAEGTCEGHIATTPRGSEGFGYDPLFIPDGYERTMAELASKEKDRISHRGKAAAQLINLLRAGKDAARGLSRSC